MNVEELAIADIANAALTIAHGASLEPETARAAIETITALAHRQTSAVAGDLLFTIAKLLEKNTRP